MDVSSTSFFSSPIYTYTPTPSHLIWFWVFFCQNVFVVQTIYVFHLCASINSESDKKFKNACNHTIISLRSWSRNLSNANRKRKKKRREQYNVTRMLGNSRSEKFSRGKCLIRFQFSAVQAIDGNTKAHLLGAQLEMFDIFIFSFLCINNPWFACNMIF